MTFDCWKRGLIYLSYVGLDNSLTTQSLRAWAVYWSLLDYALGSRFSLSANVSSSSGEVEGRRVTGSRSLADMGVRRDEHVDSVGNIDWDV